jgi:hypothetical protein
LARGHHRSRQFIDPQADQAEQARTEAFGPQPPADAAVRFDLPVTEAWLQRLLRALLLLGHRSYRRGAVAAITSSMRSSVMASSGA